MAVFFCRQCAAENGGPVVDLKPGRNTIALKGLCGLCGFVWMDRDGSCCDAECPVHHPKQNTPETGQHRLARQAAPIGNAQEHRASGRRSIPFSYEF